MDRLRYECMNVRTQTQMGFGQFKEREESSHVLSTNYVPRSVLVFYLHSFT